MSRFAPRRIYWRLLRAIGFRKLSWDLQFKAGVWGAKPRSPHTINAVLELGKGGYLVEFGCGTGTLPLALPRNTFSKYEGYDISEFAVKKATEIAQAKGYATYKFNQADMAEWKGTSGATLILAEECINYPSLTEVENFMRVCSRSLAPGGKILVIIHDGIKHAASLDVCRKTCNVVSDTVVDSRAFLVLSPKK